MRIPYRRPPRKIPMPAKWLMAVALAGLLCACRADDAPNRETPRNPSRDAALQGPPRPPTPPVTEDFEGTPKLSLFPRLGDYRPENADAKALSFWNTYLDHLVHTAGVVSFPDGGHAFGMRGVAELDAIGFFAPLAVEPGTRYRIGARSKAALGESSRAGLGILEFDQFLWIAEQYPRSLAEQHQTGIQEGFELTGASDWQSRSFEIVTGPKTRMVHLVFYLEGAENRTPVLWDDIRVEKAEP